MGVLALLKDYQCSVDMALFLFLALVSLLMDVLFKGFRQPAALQTLSLHPNQLTALPKSFGQLGNLQMLWLYRNQFTVLPVSFGQQESLQTR